MDWLARLKATLNERQTTEIAERAKINLFDCNTAERQKRNVTPPTENFQHGESMEATQHSCPQKSPARTRRQVRPTKNVKAEQPPDNQWVLDLEPATDTLQSGTICKNYGPQ